MAEKERGTAMIIESKTELKNFTPDEMRELYKTDPKLFDKLAAEAIKKACIADTPEGTLRLQRMQWSIDAQLMRAKTQPERMEIMENIFYGQVFGSNGNLAHMVDAFVELAHIAKEPEEMPAVKPVLHLVKR